MNVAEKFDIFIACDHVPTAAADLEGRVAGGNEAHMTDSVAASSYHWINEEGNESIQFY